MREGVLSYYYIRRLMLGDTLVQSKRICSNFVPPIGAFLDTDKGRAVVTSVTFSEKPIRDGSTDWTAEVIVLAHYCE